MANIVTAPSAAVTVTGAKKIRVTNAIPTWLQIAELQAVEAITGTNVTLASKGATAASSGHDYVESNHDNAIDGVFPAAYPAIYHSGGDGADQFLEITLAAPANLASVTLYGRTDMCSDRDFYNITIFNEADVELFSGQLDNRALKGGGNTLTFDVATASALDLLPTVKIGTQEWMSKNLDVAFYCNGDLIPQVTDPTEWAALTTGAWCYYNNDPILGEKYGKLYNWYAVSDPRGLAPQGWHIPHVADWKTLATTLGGDSVAGGKMKEAGMLNWTTPNTGADNSSGWTGLPGGVCTPINTGSFNIGVHGSWWSSAYDGNTSAYNYFLFSDSSHLSPGINSVLYGYSVRCIRD